MTSVISRNEIWLANFNHAREQSVKRPVLVVSVDEFNHGYSELVVVIPLTTKDKNIPLHVKIVPPEGGLDKISFIKCENILSISSKRLEQRLGIISDGTMQVVEKILRMLLKL